MRQLGIDVGADVAARDAPFEQPAHFGHAQRDHALTEGAGEFRVGSEVGTSPA
jgi:hypothetical protein